MAITPQTPYGTLFGLPVPAPAAVPFAGCDLQPEDIPRLTKQIDCIVEVVADQQWRTVQRLAQVLRGRHPGVGFPENSVQAQLRNLRKVGYTVERRRVGNGLNEYRVLPPNNPGVGMAQKEVA